MYTTLTCVGRYPLHFRACPSMTSPLGYWQLRRGAIAIVAPCRSRSPCLLERSRWCADLRCRYCLIQRHGALIHYLTSSLAKSKARSINWNLYHRLASWLSCLMWRGLWSAALYCRYYHEEAHSQICTCLGSYQLASFLLELALKSLDLASQGLSVARWPYNCHLAVS